MGTVYRATGSDGKPVAIKFLSPALAQNSEVVARFAREIAMLARLDHPGDCARARPRRGGRYFPGSRWIWSTGPTCARAWRARCRRRRPPRFRFAARGAGVRARCGRGPPRSQTGESLAGARRRAAGRLRRGALGRRGAGRAAASTRLTETAAVIGTLPYMSPEQRRGGAAIAARIVLYWRDAEPGLDRWVAAGRVPAALVSLIALMVARTIDWCCACCNRIARRPSSADEAAVSLAAALQPRAARLIRHAARAAVLVAVLAASVLVGARSGAVLRRTLEGGAFVTLRGAQGESGVAATTDSDATNGDAAPRDVGATGQAREEGECAAEQEGRPGSTDQEQARASGRR